MIISSSLYNEIVTSYMKHRTLNCLRELVAEFPQVPEMTLESIIHQIFQKRMENEYWEHRKSVAFYYDRYLNAENEGEFGVLLEMATKMDFSPALMARMVIEQHYTTLLEKDTPSLTDSQKKELKRKIVSDVRNPAQIKDGRLAAEIQTCHMHDTCYGPIADKLKRAIGSDYERYLKGVLKAHGIHFRSEPKLRGRGFDKTPDILLLLPICIDNKPINWIESKASFGDVERHKEYFRNQYMDYRKRFGPGLIIYWFGYLKEAVLFKHRDLIIVDSMPTDITHMDPKCVSPEKATRWFRERGSYQISEEIYKIY